MKTIIVDISEIPAVIAVDYKLIKCVEEKYNIEIILPIINSTHIEIFKITFYDSDESLYNILIDLNLTVVEF